jgi:arsenite methyltransferase
MHSCEPVALYERLAPEPFAGEGMRPGGLELTKRSLAYCNFSPESKVLDIGCGNGATIDHLAKSHGVFGVGTDSSAISASQAHFRDNALPIVQGLAESLPFPSNFADGVLAECSLSTMTDLRRAVKEFNRVMKVDGNLIVSDIYARESSLIPKLRLLPLNSCLRGAIHLEEFMSILNDQSFKIQVCEDHSELLKQFMVRMVFGSESMPDFLCPRGSHESEHRELRTIVRNSKPGYFLLIATKF